MASGDDGASHQRPLPLASEPIGHTCQTIALEAFLDTGFDGDIVIPPGLGPSVAAPDHYLLWILVDGSPMQAPAYFGTVQVGPLGAFPVAVTVLGDEPIVGRRLNDRFRVTLDHGRQLIVER